MARKLSFKVMAVAKDVVSIPQRVEDAQRINAQQTLRQVAPIIRKVS